MTWWCDKKPKTPTRFDRQKVVNWWSRNIRFYLYFSYSSLRLYRFYLIWSCFYCWIGWFIIFKLRFKSRDLDSSSQVQGSPCGQELGKLGPQTHRMLVMWAQGQLGTAYPIRTLALLSLTNQRRAEAGSCGQHMPDPSQQSSSRGQRAAGGQPGPDLASLASGHQLLGSGQASRPILGRGGSLAENNPV